MGFHQHPEYTTANVTLNPLVIHKKILFLTEATNINGNVYNRQRITESPRHSQKNTFSRGGNQLKRRRELNLLRDTSLTNPHGCVLSGSKLTWWKRAPMGVPE